MRLWQIVVATMWEREHDAQCVVHVSFPNSLPLCLPMQWRWCLLPCLMPQWRLGQVHPLPSYVLWTQSATSSTTSSKSKVPQVDPVIRPARDPEKQGAHAKPSGDLISRDQTRNKSPHPSRVSTRDKSRDSTRFGQARSPLINKWQTMGMVCNQRRHVTPEIGYYQ